MKKFIVIFTVVLLGFSSLSFSDEVKEDTSHKEVMQVVEDFRTSIIEKDEAKFVKLFYDKSIPWLGIYSEKRTGKLPSQYGVDHGSYVGFIAWIVAVPDKVEEKFWDIEVATDGEIASVHFKYSFHVSDYKENWGDEAWHLVRTGDGWKINSVIYSVTRNPVPRKEKS